MTDSPAQVDVRLSADLTVIRPGDTVLVRIPRITSCAAAQLDAVRERLRERLPDVEVLVLCGIDALDVYRPTDTAPRRQTP